jgi:hypothetical protein
VHLVAAPLNEEGFFSIHGVPGQGAVGEPGSPRFLHHVDYFHWFDDNTLPDRIAATDVRRYFRASVPAPAKSKRPRVKMLARPASPRGHSEGCHPSSFAGPQ